MKCLIFTLNFVLLVIFIAGCGSTRPIEEIYTPDVPGTTADTSITDTGFTDADQIQDTSTFKICNKGEACNQLPLEDSHCYGECYNEMIYLSCEGTVVDNLCYLLTPPEKPYTKDIIDDIKITHSQIPDYVFVGDRLEIELILTNLRDEKNYLTYGFKNPDSWEIRPQNFDYEGILSFEPKEEKRLRFNANAIKPNILEHVHSYIPIITFSFNYTNYELYAKIRFDKRDEYIKCGEEYFPATYCSTQDCTGYSNYNSAVCCNSIFYPGATCCNTNDCVNGTCIDGKCIYRVPSMFLANTTLIQNNRILIIISDFPEFPESELCRDKYKELKDKLQLDLIDEYYKTIVYNRTGRKDVVNFRWEVLAGFNSDKFITNGDYTFQNFKNSLNDYINSQLKCDINFDDYDKIIIISFRMDLYGFGGMAFGLGNIGQIQYSNGYLTAHELCHSFGASDLYLDMGGSFQYATSLMGNNLGQIGFPQDRVAWGEIGLSDVNENGVIDIFEFARFPESIVIENIHAKLTQKESLEISFEPYLIERGRKMRGVFLMYHIELPEYNQIIDTPEPFIAFDQYQVDLKKIRETRKIKVRIVINYKYSDNDFKRKALNFDKTIEIDVEDQIR